MNYIWKLRFLGRLKPLRLLAQSYFRNIRYRDGKDVVVRAGPLKGMKWKCRDGEQFYMPMGVYEHETSEWLKAALRPGDVFLDIGANAGYFSLLGARAVGAMGRVIAFEPTPHYAESIREKILLNNLANVEVHRSAVGNSNEESVDFVVEKNGPNSHLAMIELTHTASSKSEIIPTPVVTTDGFCRQRNLHPNVIKVDVEGAEVLVLEGMAELIRRDKPRLIISTHSGALKRDCIALLTSLGAGTYDLPGFEHEVITWSPSVS